MTNVEILQGIFEKRAEEERGLSARHPWVPIFFNWLVAAVLVMLAISFALWGIEIKIQTTAEALTAEAMETREQEQKAAEDSEKERQEALAASEEAIIEAESRDCARALYGIRRFIEKYGYSESDLLTYLRSAFNRADAKVLNLHDVLSDGQYLEYKESNDVLTEYLQVSEKAVREWHTEKAKPCDVSYQFAELTEKGIWLKNDINADGYALRWRHS